MTRSPLLTARTSAVFLALALSAFGLSACGEGSPGKTKIEGAATAPADMRSVRVIKVESRELTGGLVASGVLVSREEASVGSELAGFRVARVLVEEGAVVAAGQPLVQLDDTLIQAQIEQQTALVAQQAVAARQSQLQADRVVGLQGQGVVSEEQLQQRQFQAESSRAALAAQTAILNDFKTRQARMTIRAPVGGRVLERTVRPGDISGGGTYFRIARDPNALHLPTMLRIWGEVLRHPTFRAFALLSLAAYGALFTYLASSSFIFIQVLHLTGLQLGWILASMSVVYITGTIVCRFLLRHIGMRKTIALAGLFSLGSGMSLCWMVYGGEPSALGLVLSMYPMVLAHGVHQPIGQSGAVGPFPLSAGAASAMNGFLMMVAAFGTGLWLSHSIDGTLFPLAHGIAFWGVALALTAWTLVQWHGEPVQAD